MYESLVLSILLYGAETWPMTVTNMKRLEAAHHRRLGIAWKDEVRNEEVRRRTGMDTLENTMMKKRSRWFGHVHVQRTEGGKVT